MKKSYSKMWKKKIPTCIKFNIHSLILFYFFIIFRICYCRIASKIMLDILSGDSGQCLMNKNVFWAGLHCHMLILVHSQRDFITLPCFKRCFLLFCWWFLASLKKKKKKKSSMPFTRRKPTGLIPCCYPSLMLAHHQWSDNCGNQIWCLQNERQKCYLYFV